MSGRLSHAGAVDPEQSVQGIMRGVGGEQEGECNHVGSVEPEQLVLGSVKAVAVGGGQEIHRLIPAKSFCVLSRMHKEVRSSGLVST
jgi:hypothetical protein